jgi:hypothetical protein
MPGSDEPVDEPADETAGDDYTEEENEAMAEEYFAQQRALKPRLYEKRPLPDWIASGPNDENEQPDEEPPPTRLIRMTFVFKPDEYAAVEAGLRKAQGQMRKRHTQSEQLVHVMQQFLATGSECTKARYPVVIQIEGHDAVYVTDRGDLPVPADKLQGLRAQARPPRKSPRARLASVVKNTHSADLAAEQPADGMSHVGQPQAEEALAVGVPTPRRAAEQPADGMSHVGQPQAEEALAVGVPTPRRVAEQPIGDLPPTGDLSGVGQPRLSEVVVVEALPECSASRPPVDNLSHVGRGEAATASTTPASRSRRRTATRPNAIREVMARSGWACVICGSRDRLELDHAVQSAAAVTTMSEIRIRSAMTATKPGTTTTSSTTLFSPRAAGERSNGDLRRSRRAAVVLMARCRHHQTERSAAAAEARERRWF